MYSHTHTHTHESQSTYATRLLPHYSFQCCEKANNTMAISSNVANHYLDARHLVISRLDISLLQSCLHVNLKTIDWDTR